ncbi:MAG: hypothetical protein AAGH45_07980, partial [Pseudomonadota bacterium]
DLGFTAQVNADARGNFAASAVCPIGKCRMPTPGHLRRVSRRVSFSGGLKKIIGRLGVVLFAIIYRTDITTQP